MANWGSLQNRQQGAVRFLTNSHAKNRLVHAYIFEGPKGVGKLALAKGFAKMVLCESGIKECSSCRHCQMVEEGGHVNVIHVAPVGKSIKKEQIQELQQEFTKMAAENVAKIYIIEGADKMSLSASNSLLKFLEEPAANTYALLLTHNSEMLLPTIRSRSVLLKLKPLGKTQLLENFRKQGIGKFAPLVMALTQNLDEARLLTESENFNFLVDLVLKIETALVKTGFDPSIIIAQHSAALKEAGAARTFLKLYMIFYRDILAIKLQAGHIPGFSFHPEALELSVEQNDVASCGRKLKVLMDAERRLVGNANALLTFDWLFLEMKGGNGRGI
ncbi:MAG: AAA family ATPase [Turicibacter sp.]|nr:AAA family ATPase [Turicibacter sp.]